MNGLPASGWRTAPLAWRHRRTPSPPPPGSGRWPRSHRSSGENSTRSLGPCEVEAKRMGPPRVRVTSVRSAAPIGSPAVFYTVAEGLRRAEEVRDALAADEPTAIPVLVVPLNRLVACAPLAHIDGWAQATPLTGWANLTPEEISHNAVEGALYRLCRPARRRERGPYSATTRCRSRQAHDTTLHTVKLSRDRRSTGWRLVSHRPRSPSVATEEMAAPQSAPKHRQGRNAAG